LKSRANLVIAVVAAAILATIAYRGVTRHPANAVASKPSAISCTPEAIKQVSDALERSILSANCAKREKAGAN